MKRQETEKANQLSAVVSYLCCYEGFLQKEDGISCCQSEDCQKCNPPACPEDKKKKKKKRHVKGQFSAGWTPEGVQESHSLDLSGLEGTCLQIPFK